MPRPRNCRYVSCRPCVTYFKPRGIPLTELRETRLTVEGLEALRLADMEGLTTGAAAERMRVSRHTFGRTLAEAPCIRRIFRLLRPICGTTWNRSGTRKPAPCRRGSPL